MSYNTAFFDPAVSEMSANFFTQSTSASTMIMPSHAQGRPTRATQPYPLMHKIVGGEPLALDIEFSSYRTKDSGDKFNKRRLGQVALVNTNCETILHCYVNYDSDETIENGPHWSQSGIEESDLLLENGAVPGKVAERWVKEIVRCHPVVVHGGSSDRRAFFHENIDDLWADSDWIDTQKLYTHIQGRGAVGLKTAAREVLGKEIQQGTHCPVQDAVATMGLYLKARPFDRRAATTAQNHGDPFQSGGHIAHRKVHGVEAVNQSTMKYTLDDFPILGVVAPGRNKR